MKGCLLNLAGSQIIMSQFFSASRFSSNFNQITVCLCREWLLLQQERQGFQFILLLPKKATLVIYLQKVKPSQHFSMSWGLELELDWHLLYVQQLKGRYIFTEHIICYLLSLYLLHYIALSRKYTEWQCPPGICIAIIWYKALQL